MRNIVLAMREEQPMASMYRSGVGDNIHISFPSAVWDDASEYLLPDIDYHPLHAGKIENIKSYGVYRFRIMTVGIDPDKCPWNRWMYSKFTTRVFLESNDLNAEIIHPKNMSPVWFVSLRRFNWHVIQWDGPSAQECHDQAIELLRENVQCHMLASSRLTYTKEIYLYNENQ